MSTKSTISELQRKLVRDLSALFAENEAISVSTIVLDHLNITREDILRNPNRIANNETQVEIKKIVDQLQQNKPIQYILGKTFFYDLEFKVNSEVLIPRPETEELTHYIIKENNKKNPVILDIGTGSGCIAIALSVNIPNSIVLGMDVNIDTLNVARENAFRNNSKVMFIHGNILNCKSLKGTKWIDLIVSNPPYVTLEDKKKMSSNVVDYEPERALFVPQNDPLLFYKHIIKFAEFNLSTNGEIWVEINENFGQETAKLFIEQGYENVDLRKDLQGKNRFIKASR